MPMFRELVSYQKAQEIVTSKFPTKPLGTEKVALLNSFNRILAQDIKSGLAIPPFDRSTVDGYAVKAADTFCARENQAVRLLIVGAACAGKMPKTRVTEGSAVEIVTGAPIPKGADAIVMMEDTEHKGKELFVYDAVVEGENIQRRGSDLKLGELIVRKNETMGYAEIGLTAAVGVSNVRVNTVPRVAVLSTGPEVVKLGKRLPPGKIYDINAYSLSAAVTESGGQPIFLGVYPDDDNLIRQVLIKGLRTADVVITSGGVSIGPKDLMPKVLNSLGEPGVIISGIAIKPGKPTTMALIDGKPIFALPGHPTSALMVFHLFARPLIERLAGRDASIAPELTALAGVRLFPAKGRRTFVMVKLRRDKRNRWIADPVAPGESGAIATLARSDGFVEISESVQFVDYDEKVTVHLFRNGIDRIPY